MNIDTFSSNWFCLITTDIFHLTCTVDQKPANRTFKPFNIQHQTIVPINYFGLSTSTFPPLIVQPQPWASSSVYQWPYHWSFKDSPPVPKWLPLSSRRRLRRRHFRFRFHPQFPGFRRRRGSAATNAIRHVYRHLSKPFPVNMVSWLWFIDFFYVR